MLERAVTIEGGERDWSPALRVGFRFAFLYVFLFNLPFPIYLAPGGDWLASHYMRAWHAIVIWVGEHVLRLDRPIAIVVTGSGDTTYDYVRVLCVAALAVAGTLIWCLAAQARRYSRLHEVLRVYLRYVLATALLAYGLFKVFKLQFLSLEPYQLVQRFGETSPMGLLWKLMGHSTVYCVVTGVVETMAGALLLFRRTTFAGALLSIVAMTQVVLLNLCFDVPVKLLSMHLLAMSILVTAPDLRRLAALLLARVPARGSPAVRIAKAALIAAIVYPVLTQIIGLRRLWGDDAPKPALYGLYEVESFVADGVERPPLVTDAARWRTFAVSRFSDVRIRGMDDSERALWMVDDPVRQRITLATREHQYVLAYLRPDPDHLVLDGDFAGQTIRARLRKVDPRSFVLVRRGFHWISEEPFLR